MGITRSERIMISFSSIIAIVAIVALSYTLVVKESELAACQAQTEGTL